MKQKTVRILAALAILSLFLQPSPIQAHPSPMSSEAPSQRVESNVDLPLPAGLTSSEWQSIQNQIMSNLSPQAYLKASNTDAYDYFGNSVAISGNTLVIGAPYECSSAKGVDGDQSDNSALASGAAYVFVRSDTNWTQQAYLKASNTETSDNFGYSVAISGNTIVIGAIYEDSSAKGVNGDEYDEDAFESGSVYVFVRSGETWSQQAYLKASNTETSDNFGYSVAISSNTIVVGAPGEDSSAKGVGGDEDNNSAVNSGAAYVFVGSSGVWTQQAYLKASNTGAIDWFGVSVAISGETIVVGAYSEDSSATGGQADNSAVNSGAAYVFVRSGETWSQQAYLKASNTETSDNFGCSVAISSNTIVVGAYGEDSSATGVNGDESDNSASLSGAAYIFERSGIAWSQQAYLKASNTETSDFFGFSVAISADTLVVGAHDEDSSSKGIDGDQTDNSALASGAAYIFERSGTEWSQQAYLKASNTETIDYFGYSIAISADTLVVGAFVEDSNAKGVNGDQSDNSAENSGAAYVFKITHKLFLPLIVR